MWRETVEQVANMMVMDPVSRLPGQVLLDAGAQCRPQAGAEAAPAALGGLLQSQHHPPRGAARHRRAHLRLHRSRGGAAVGGRLLRDVQEGVRAHRPRGEPQHRHGDLLLVPPRRGGGAAPRHRRLPLLPVRPRPPLRLRHAQAGPHQYLEQVRGGARRPGHGADGRRHRRHRHAGAAARPPARPSRTRASIRPSSSSRAATTGTSTSASRWSSSRGR